MTAEARPRLTRREAGWPDCTDGLAAATAVPKQRFRDKIQAKPGLTHGWRIGVFLAAAAFWAVGHFHVVDRLRHLVGL